MTFTPAPGPAEAMKTFKVSIPESAYHQLEKQAIDRGISVKQHTAPLVVALARGEIRPGYGRAEQPVPIPAAAPLTVQQRLAGIKGISGACRAVFIAVCEAYELSGGQKQADTNRELAQVLGLGLRTVSDAISRLETAGWLQVRLFAAGGDGRHLWPTEKARAAYGGTAQG